MDLTSMTATLLVSKLPDFGEITQNNDHPFRYLRSFKPHQFRYQWISRMRLTVRE